MHQSNLLITLIISVLLIACDCDKTVECPKAATEAVDLLPAKANTLVFRSQNPDSLLRLYNMPDVFSSFSIEHCSGPANDCRCPDCGPAYHYQVYETLAPIFSIDSSYIQLPAGTTYNGAFFPNDTAFYVKRDVKEDDADIIIFDMLWKDQVDLRYCYLDFCSYVIFSKEENELNLDPNSLSIGDSLMAQYITPVSAYQSVIRTDVRHRDTNSTVYSNSAYFSIVYYSLNEGLVAFEDLEGNYFYRL